PVVLHALAVPPLTTKSWNGSATTAWTTAANWTPSGAPGSGDRVFIPAARPNQPSLSGPVSLTDLALQAGATLSAGPNNVTVSGNLVAAGGIAGTGTVFLAGTGSVSGSVPNLQVNG